MDEQSLLTTDKAANWQLKALTEALDNLTLPVSDSLSVGRGSDNDVVLGSKEVSRNHALLSVLDGQLYVKDLTSSNGTFVNNERIESNQSTLLKLNDTLGFASFDFTVLQSEIVADTGVASNISTAPVTGANATTNTQTDIEALSAGIKNDITTDPVSDSSPSTSAKPAIVEETVIEEAVVDDVVLDEIVLDEIVLEQDVATEDRAESASLTSNKTEQPVVKKTIIKDVLASGDSANDMVNSENPVDDNLLNNSAPAMPVAAALATEPTPSTPTEQQTVISNKIPKQPLVKELPTKESVSPEPLTTAPVTDEPLMHDRASHQESVVSPEHDKTTTTALQEEADPDVLRAKQAATSQFSGTANLGAGRDLGTEGNNAMDQAIDNPANAEHPDKKPSGSWFIWVFIALIIIGIALWLFNMGGV